MLQQSLLGGRLTTQATVQVGPTALGRLLIELLQIGDPWNRDHEVATGEADQSFHVTLLIGAAHQTEVMLKQKVAFQPQELPGRRIAAPADELGYGNPAVVVADARRYAAEELKCPAVSFLKRLGTLPGEHLSEEGFAERQRHHEAGDLRLLPLQDDDRFAEVGLGLMLKSSTLVKSLAELSHGHELTSIIAKGTAIARC